MNVLGNYQRGAFFDNVRHAKMVEWILFSLISSNDTTLCNSRERTAVGERLFQFVPLKKQNEITSNGIEVRAITRRKLNQALCLTWALLFRAQTIALPPVKDPMKRTSRFLYCVLCILIMKDSISVINKWWFSLPNDDCFTVKYWKLCIMQSFNGNSSDPQPVPLLAWDRFGLIIIIKL